MNRTSRRRHMPRIFTSPPSNLNQNFGAELAEVTETAGRPLDTWQHTVLEKASRINSHTDEGTNPLPGSWTWSASEVGLLVSRWNGKTFIAEARELAGLFTLGERIVHTAYNLDAAEYSMRSLLTAIKSTPGLVRQVSQVSRTRGALGIMLNSGAEIRYSARGPASLDAAIDADLLVLDDAEHLPEPWTVTAVNGTSIHRPTSKRRQVWYVGTAVDEEWGRTGRAFTAVRNRGLSGTDPKLCWIEYSASDARGATGGVLVDREDPAVIARANPSERLTAGWAAERLIQLTPREFEVQHLGIGYWPDLTEPAA